MQIREEWYDAGKERCSRRNYSEECIEQAQIDKIQALIEEVNQESGLSFEFVADAPDWTGGFKASYGMIKGAKSFIVLKGNKQIESFEEKIGYYGEAVVLECTALGLGTCWLGGTYDKQACQKQMKLGQNEVISCIIVVGKVKNAPGLKEKLLSKMTGKGKKAETFLAEPQFSDVPKWVRDGLECVAQAPSALNKQPVIYHFKQNEVETSISEKNQGYEHVDLGIAMLHFEIGARQEGYKGSWRKTEKGYSFK